MARIRFGPTWSPPEPGTRQKVVTPTQSPAPLPGPGTFFRRLATWLRTTLDLQGDQLPTRLLPDVYPTVDTLRPVTRIFSVVNPAAGAVGLIGPPLGFAWELEIVIFGLTTSGTVANREPHIRIERREGGRGAALVPSTILLFDIAFNVTITATQSRSLSAGAGLGIIGDTTTGATDIVVTSLPVGLLLTDEMQLDLTAIGLQVDDQIEEIHVVAGEWQI